MRKNAEMHIKVTVRQVWQCASIIPAIQLVRGPSVWGQPGIYSETPLQKKTKEETTHLPVPQSCIPRRMLGMSGHDMRICKKKKKQNHPSLLAGCKMIQPHCKCAPRVFKWLNTEFPSDPATPPKVETQKQETTHASKNTSICSSIITVCQLLMG